MSGPTAAGGTAFAVPVDRRRRTLVAVSLKSYLDPVATRRWADRVASLAARHPAVASGDVELVVLPAVTALAGTLAACSGSPVAVGAQDLHWQDRGAITGGVSGADLAMLGCSFVELAHAERRRIFGETDAMFGAKLAAALRNGMTPIVCTGEAERGDARSAAEACIGQLEAILAAADLAEPADVVLAYEPEWAIGQAESASPDHVREVASRLRAWAAGHPALGHVRVLYGGSAGPGLLPALAPAVDGLFLGRFAHDPDALARVLDDAVAITA